MRDYLKLPSGILSLIYAEFCIQMVNATLMYLLPVFMAQKYLRNDEIAWEIVCRFAGVFILAIPLGALRIGRHTLRMFRWASLLVPMLGMGIVWGVDLKNFTLASVLLFLWGASFTFMQVPVIPYLLKHVSSGYSTHALSLSYSTWSFGSIVSGILIYVLSKINPELFCEKNLMLGICLMALTGFISLWLITPPMHAEYVKESEKNNRLSMKDGLLLSEALLPTLIIAVGAGFTIPLISLFFYRVHRIPSTDFSLFSFLAAVLVAFGSLSVPWIKKNFSYKIAVPLTQSLAVLFLIILAYTEDFSAYDLALPVALISFLLRQPLMNMAGPMTTEVVMEYVGDKRRGLASAITSGIWSGSYVISGLLAGQMFYSGLSFKQVFLVTAVLYIFGILFYYKLILKYEQTKKIL
ncbi:MAG: MFS transporter [Bacteroidia bacterium]|nr:MFS transporter [Bacteroidia bacterium]